MGSVSALRETSVLFVALISTFMLKESVGAHREPDGRARRRPGVHVCLVEADRCALIERTADERGRSPSHPPLRDGIRWGLPALPRKSSRRAALAHELVLALSIACRELISQTRKIRQLAAISDELFDHPDGNLTRHACSEN